MNGLPRKRTCATGRCPFRSLPILKKTVILTWLVLAAAATSTLKGRPLEKQDVETQPQSLHCGILDETVDIQIVLTYFRRRRACGDHHRKPEEVFASVAM